MTTYINLGLGGGEGSPFYGDPVPDFASLPGSGQLGELRLTLDTGVIYYWDSLAWNVAETEVATVGHTDTDSIDLSTPGSILNANLNLSADAASAGFLKATTSIKSGVNKGLHVELPIADTSTTGVITDTDWDTFNNKEPAITATTIGDYWRGDKTFQPLNIDAMAVLAGGALNPGSKLLGIESATSGYTLAGATDTWGSAVSVSLAAGTWLVYGVCRWSAGDADIISLVQFGISKSATGVGIGDFDYQAIPVMFSENGLEINNNTPFVILSDASPFTAHLNTFFTYTTDQPTHSGKIVAMRIR